MIDASDDLVARLRDALLAAGYTHDGVVATLGPEAHSALGRNETAPGLRATADAGPVGTLTRLWVLQATVDRAALERALPQLVEDLSLAGLLRSDGDEIAALVDLRPYAADDTDLWVLSDLTPGLDGASISVTADHVLGLSPAATSLAGLTVRRPVGRALDLGTGCGVQALYLATHADDVVGTDVNPRALQVARLNVLLNELEVHLREGSLFDPVRDDRFDLVVSNPPFVIGPGSNAVDDRLVYRDSGLPGDDVVRRIVTAAPRHLTEGGVCQVLANWLVPRDASWQERLAGWLDGVDAWVVQRERTDLATYVELWLKDAGVHPSTGGDPVDYRARYDAWLGWLEEAGAEAVGFGWINLRRTDAEPSLRLEEWPWEVAQPLGDEVADQFARIDRLRGLDDAALLASRLRLRPDVRQETQGAPGAADPTDLVLRQQQGMRRARRVGTAEAALVGACDGELTVARLLGAVEQIVGEGVPVAVVRELVADGFLTLA